MKPFLRVFACLGLIAGAAACAEPPSSHPAASGPEAAIAEALRTGASAYPDAQIKDLVVNGAVACARIHSAGRRSHALYAIRRDGEWIVATPLLMKPDSWDLPGNRQISDGAQQTCRELNAPLPAE